MYYVINNGTRLVVSNNPREIAFARQAGLLNGGPYPNWLEACTHAGIPFEPVTPAVKTQPNQCQYCRSQLNSGNCTLITSTCDACLPGRHGC